jgi:HPt (histidine-containing phosphotransfer) domain-containing protein
LEEAFGKKDFAAVAAIAHKVKSSVGALHVRRLAKLLDSVETAAAGGSDCSQELHQLVADAFREWDAVRKVFDEARSN